MWKKIAGTRLFGGTGFLGFCYGTYNALADIYGLAVRTMENPALYGAFIGGGLVMLSMFIAAKLAESGNTIRNLRFKLAWWLHEDIETVGNFKKAVRDFRERQSDKRKNKKF